MLPARGALLRARLTLLGLATLVVLLAALLSPLRAGAAVTPLPTAAERYGINAAGMISVGGDVATAAHRTLTSGGIRVVRIDLPWGRVEPVPPVAGVHTYDWSGVDAQVASLARDGLRAYPVVDYAALWASTIPGDQMSHPRDPLQFATFAAAGARRYGPGGAFWADHPELPQLPIKSLEIWNEPNSQDFWREQRTAPADFARLYLASRIAIRAVSPTIEVVSGGLVDNGADEFIEGMFRAVPQLRGNLDALGFHVYLRAPKDALDRLNEIRAVLDRVDGPGTPIEITEVGWSSLEGSEQQRGDNLAAFSRLTSAPALKVTRIIPYCAMSIEANPQHWEEWFGILNWDGTPKPSFVRWSAEIARLDAGAAVAALPKVRLGRRAARASGRMAKVRTAKTRSSAKTRTAKARAATRRATTRAARR